MAQIEAEFDLVIAGGGAIGSTLALALAKLGQYRIGVIESSESQLPPSNAFDTRVIALAHQSYQFLTTLLADEYPLLGTDIKHIHVSDRGHLGQCQLHHDEYRVPALGKVVEINHLGERLYQQVANHSAIQWFRPAHISKLDYHSDTVDITLDGQSQVISTRLLVITEGGNSSTRQLAGFEWQTKAYGQSALIANVALDSPHQHWAYERFTENGPLALLPMDACGPHAGYYSLVWTIHPEQQEDYLAMPRPALLRRLQQEFGYRAGLFKDISQPVCYPLTLSSSDTLTRHRTVILGNAAQTLHPIAGQGMNLGLRDVQTLVAQLSAPLNHHDPGSYRCLDTYARQRCDDRRKTMNLTDGLVGVFSNSQQPLVFGRNAGLMSMALMPELRAKLAMQAMGAQQQENIDGIL